MERESCDRRQIDIERGIARSNLGYGRNAELLSHQRSHANLPITALDYSQPIAECDSTLGG